MSSTDHFQNRPISFEATRRRLESPGERTRGGATGSVPRVEEPKARPEVLHRSITWGTTFKISLAIYFALMGVLVTLALLSLLALRLAVNFASDQLDEFKVEWNTMPSVSQSPTTG